MRLVSGSLILVLGLMSSAHAEGDALVDMLGPREIAVGEALRGGATGSSSITMNPAGLPLNRELVFEGGFGYRMSDEASIFGISACDSTNAAPGCFYYNYAGANPELGGMQMHRRTHQAGAAFGYPVTPRVFIGTAVKYFNVEDEAMPSAKASGWNTDLGTTLRVSNMINIGAVAQNLWGADSAEYPRAIGGGIMARPMPNLAVSFDARWKLDGDDHATRYGGGAELFLRTSNGTTGFPLRIGGLRDNSLGSTYVTGGLGLASLKYSIDVGARYAVTGADETMLIASMRFYGPRLAAPGVELAE